jgi:hypothetical protein
MKTLFKAIGLALGIVAPTLAAGPAGSFILNVSTSATSPAFNVASGTVSGAFTIGPSGGIQMQNLSGNQCLQTSGDGHVITSGSACSASGSSTILNQNTLQSGATFYVSSGTVAGQFITSSNTYIGYGGTGLQSNQVYLGNNAAQVYIPNLGNGFSARIVEISSTVVGNPLTATNLQASDIPSGSSLYIQNSNTLQSGATFYVSSGTVANQLNVNGSGNGQVILTISGSTYTVISSSVAPTVGQYAIASSTNNTVQWVNSSGGGGGSPGGPTFAGQYNNSGNLGGSLGWLYYPSTNTMSLRTISTIGGELDFWNTGNNNRQIGLYTDAGAFQGQLSILNGSSGYFRWDDESLAYFGLQTGGSDRLRIEYGGAIDAVSSMTVLNSGGLGVTYGVIAGSVTVSPATAITNALVVMSSVSTPVLSVSNSIPTVTASTYMLSISSGLANSTTDFFVDASGDFGAGNGVGTGYAQLTSKTHAAITASTPGNPGEYYYCSDCSTVSTCVSTGTAVGAWALITNKGSPCQ